MNKSVITRNDVDGIYFCYTSSSEPPINLDVNHCHDEFEMLYVTSGNGKYVIEGTEYPIRPGTLLFAPPFAYHSVRLTPGVSYERYVVQFSASHLTGGAQEFLSALSGDSDGAGCYYTAESLAPYIISNFERFEYAENLPAEERREYMKLLASEIVLLLSVSAKERIPRDEGGLGARVIKFLNENITKEITLDKLAKRFFVSKYYLCRAFKRRNGVSIHGYITHKRVMYAKQLIDNGESASGAAYKVGFCDYSAFYRAYVKIIGKSPSAEGGRDKGGK